MDSKYQIQVGVPRDDYPLGSGPMDRRSRAKTTLDIEIQKL